MTELVLKPMAVILSERNLGVKADLFLAEEVIRTTDPYVPMRTGMLKGSVRAQKTATGAEVIYTAPYARRQYYEGRLPGSSSAGSLRGRLWFERSKTTNKEKWLRSVAAYTGGKS